MKIVLVDAFVADQGDADGWPGLESLGAVERHDRTPAEQTVARCEGAAAVITNKVMLGADQIAALPELRYIGVTATGYNVIDTDAAKRRGIVVTNVPAYSTLSVAQHTTALLLELATAVASHDAEVRSGRWASSEDFAFLLRPTVELAGKNLLVIGYGEIGRSVAAIAEALGMNVLAAQIPGRPERDDRVPLDAALPEADVISLHCPLTPATQHLVNADFLARCKPDAILLNTGRGPLIDDAALVAWLADHPAARVGVDVLDTEPPPAEHRLIGHRQVMVTPHIAWATVEARRRLRQITVDNLRAWQQGTPRNRVA